MKTSDESRVKKYTFLIIAICSLVFTFSYIWNYYHEKGVARRIAENTARDHFNKDQAFRFWASSKGGIYVPVTEKTQPNPDLSHIADRDVLKPDGTLLTLMNPASMIRQVMDEYADLYGIRGRITSLKLLNQANQPDEWETTALKRMEEGVAEVFEYTEINSEPYLRLMRPMIISQECLKCHGFQEYKIGDVRGAVGVMIPLQTLFNLSRTKNVVTLLAHILFWAITMLGIVFFSKRETHRMSAQALIQQDLEYNEEINHAIVSNTTEAISIVSEEGELIFMNDNATKQFGGASDGKNPEGKIWDIYPKNSGKSLQETLQRAVESGITQTEEIESHHGNPNQWFQLSVIPIMVKNRKAALVIHVDITSFKLQNEIYKQLIEGMNDAAFVNNFNGKFIAVNEAATRHLGYSREELLNMGPADIDDTNQKEDIARLMTQLKYEEKIVLETTHRTKQGKKIPVEISGSIVLFEGELAVLSITRDISERKLAEEKIKESLREKETLLQEIHHRVKNNMNVVSSMLRLREMTSDNPEVKAALKESQGRIYAMSGVHEVLYSSDNLSEINLKMYFRSLIGTLIQTYAITQGKIRFLVEGDEIKLTINLASPLGLAINELVSNSLKYAFPGENTGCITVILSQMKEGIALTISDDGIGYMNSDQWREGDTLGLKLVRSLIETQLDGSIELTVNNGTSYSILLPENT